MTRFAVLCAAALGAGIALAFVALEVGIAMAVADALIRLKLGG